VRNAAAVGATVILLSASAAMPLTWGVAIDVPLAQT
jgi:hypothetical protein